MKSLTHSVLAVALLTALSVPSSAADIVDTAVSAGKFNTLATALKAAGLVDALKGKGPFTVFAPTDDAFAKLPEATIQSLLKPENKDQLTAILTYHVVPGKVLAEQVVTLPGAKTLNGQRVDIKVSGSSVSVDAANVVATDIQCDNGVIHVIDSVILPADKNLVDTAAEAGQFSTLLAAAKAAGLADVLANNGPLTVFAPTNEAFAKLPKGTVETLLKPENKQQLVDILKYHVVDGRVYSEDAVQAKSAKTLAGSSISVNVDDAGARINDSKLIKTDLDASNGVIHVIDAVLLPPRKKVNVQQTLENAVAKGAAMYNSGHHAACAQLYEQTIDGLMSATMDDSMKHQMSTVLTSAREQHCPTQRAWTLRRGIDRMYTQLTSTH